MKRVAKKTRRSRKVRREVPRRRWPGWMQYAIETPYDLSSHGMEVLGH
jgi:hypothetical protein